MTILFAMLKFLLGITTVVLFFCLIINFYRARYLFSQKLRVIFFIFILLGLSGYLFSLAYGLITHEEFKKSFSTNYADANLKPAKYEDIVNFTDMIFGLEEVAIFIFLIILFKELTIKYKNIDSFKRKRTETPANK